MEPADRHAPANPIDDEAHWLHLSGRIGPWTEHAHRSVRAGRARRSRRVRAMIRGGFRRLWARLRYVRFVLAEFKWSLSIFGAGNLIGATLFWQLYDHKGETLGFWNALHATFAMVFMEFRLPWPEHPALRALHFFIPILGLSVIAEGLIRLGAVLWNEENRREDWEMAVGGTYRGHVVICGLGRVGHRVVERLVAEGIDVVAVEMTKDCEFRSHTERLGVLVIVGDSTKAEVLERANVARARTILCLTDDDLVNIEAALAARKLQPDIRVIMRMFNESLAEKVSGAFGIDAVFSSTGLAAPAFAAAVFSDHIVHSFEIGDENLHLARFVIEPGSPLVGRRICDLSVEHDVTFLLHRAPGKSDLIPDPNIVISEGDFVMICARFSEVDLFERLSGSGRKRGRRPPTDRLVRPADGAAAVTSP